MRNLLIAMALLGAATPALACMCLEPTTAEQKREFAVKIAAKAAAVVDVEQIAPMNHSAMRGETYRVVAVHYGSAPAKFEMERRFSRDEQGQVGLVTTSCDVAPGPKERATVILFPTNAPNRFRFGRTCDHLFVNMPGALDLIRTEAAKLAQASERG